MRCYITTGHPLASIGNDKPHASHLKLERNKGGQQLKLENNKSNVVNLSLVQWNPKQEIVILNEDGKRIHVLMCIAKDEHYAIIRHTCASKIIITSHAHRLCKRCSIDLISCHDGTRGTMSTNKRGKHNPFEFHRLIFLSFLVFFLY